MFLIEQGRTQNMAKMLEIFISSAKEDERFLNKLLKALEGVLKPLKQRELIGIWHERDIKPGANTKKEVQEHLRVAHLFLLLISSDFMNLPFCYSEEMQYLVRRHQAGEIHIIPILLRAAYWKEAPFGEFKPLPDNGQTVSSWGDRDEAFLNIATGVKQIVDELVSPTPGYMEEPKESQSISKEFSDSSSRRSIHKPPSSFSEEQQQKEIEEFTPALPPRKQPYDGKVNYWAVVAGIGEYEDTLYAPLPACVDDAKAVAKQLTCCGYDPKHICLLVDGDIDGNLLIQELAGDNTRLSKPTRGNILEALKSVAQRTRPEDLLLFYYTGHGGLEDQESYLVTHDGRKNTLEHTALSVSALRKIMLDAPAQKKVIILDACRTEVAPGSKGMPGPLPPAFIERVFEQAKGFVLLTSCDAGENSYMWKEKQHSVFTYFLLEALQGGKADFNGKECISVDDIYKYAFDKVERWAMNNNCFQTPRIVKDGQGDIVIAYYSQDPTASGTKIGGRRTATNSPPREGTLSWREISEIIIQGEQYTLERATVREPSTCDDGTILREALVRHVETNLLLRLKQAHIVGPVGSGMKLQNILRQERQLLIELENEGYRDFPRVFPLIDGDAEKDFTFAYILPDEKSLFHTYGGSKKRLDKASIKGLLQSVLPLCEALSVLHKRNRSHRCLSLDTLVVLKGRYMMLQDIGLAAGGQQRSKNPGRYPLAPEQDQKNADIEAMPGPATDIYQLGAILYLLITGQTLSSGSLPGFRNEAVSSALDETIRLAVVREPTKRWPSIEAFSTALRKCIREAI